MTASERCHLIGRWRIVEADLWDRDYLDLAAPAMITIGAGNHGEIAFGVVQASLDLGYSPSMVFFTWAGHGPGSTKWMKSPATVTPNCSTTALSRSHLPFTMAMKPSSRRNERLLQQPARARSLPAAISRII
jgi:hypothetical protein